MECNTFKISRASARLGFWSSFLSIILFVVYIACFTAILLVNPLFQWTNGSDFVAYQLQYNQMFKYAGMFTMLVFGAAYAVLLNVIREYAAKEHKTAANIGLCFGIGFDILLSINYFVQITAIRFNVEKGYSGGLDQFIQSNPISVITSVNIMAWTLFLGLSSLFVSSVFSGGRLEKVIRYAFLADGIIMLAGGAGYVLDICFLVFTCVNFGMAIPLLIAFVALCRLFSSEGRHVQDGM